MSKFKEENSMTGLLSNIGPIIFGVVAVIILLVIMSGYVKAPPDMAFVISGMKKNPKILIGKAGIKIPFLELF